MDAMRRGVFITSAVVIIHEWAGQVQQSLRFLGFALM
jgi:hypothetical protein